MMIMIKTITITVVENLNKDRSILSFQMRKMPWKMKRMMLIFIQMITIKMIY